MTSSTGDEVLEDHGEALDDRGEVTEEQFDGALTWAAVGRFFGAVALFVVSAWAAAFVSLIGLLGGCNVSPDGEPVPPVPVSEFLCTTGRPSATIAGGAIFVIPLVLLLAAQVGYWKRRWTATTLLTFAAFVPGVAFAIIARAVA